MGREAPIDEVKEAVKIIEDAALEHSDTEEERETAEEKEEEKENKLILNNIDAIKNALKEIEEAVDSTSKSDSLIERTLLLKESLLRVYLLNYIFYKQVDKNHPVKSTLIRLSVYLEMVIKVEEKLKYKIERAVGERRGEKRGAEERMHRAEILPAGGESGEEEEKQREERRPIDYKMAKNRGYFEKRPKKEENNPRVKNKRRFEDAKELGRRVRETAGFSELKRNKRF